MTRALLFAALAVCLAFAPLRAQAERTFTLKSVAVELPGGDAMFANHGPGTEAINPSRRAR